MTSDRISNRKNRHLKWRDLVPVLNFNFCSSPLNKMSSRHFLNGPTSASFIVYFRSFQINIITNLQQINVKNVHPVYSARIRTHDLQNMNILPLTTSSRQFIINNYIKLVGPRIDHKVGLTVRQIQLKKIIYF